MIDLTLLDPSQLSTAAQRALGPGPGRMMASKGMLPLPPADQVAVLYQLHLDADATIAGTSRATAATLPEKLLSGTLADPTLVIGRQRLADVVVQQRKCEVVFHGLFHPSLRAASEKSSRARCKRE